MIGRAREWARGVDPERVARAFALGNIAFLGIDIALAHLANDFAHAVEWLPLVFSALSALLLLPGVVRPRSASARHLDAIVGTGAIVVGVAGALFHLESAFFAEQTLKNLVYSAPFIAPISYTGVGLLVLLNRAAPSDRAPGYSGWLFVLALGGFAGNLALSLLDHAQNAFFSFAEWIPVGAAAFGVGFLLVAVIAPSPTAVRAAAWVMAFEVVVGIAGAVLHGMATVARPTHSLVDRIVYGAPAFAPLLFADLAVLAGIGIWTYGRENRPTINET